MEVKELRLRNWIGFGRKENGDFLIGQVEGLHGDLMGGTVNIKNHDQTFLAQQLFPIPLTEEWLLKFGFEDVTGVYYTLHISPDFKLLLIPADGFYPQLNKADENGWQSVSLNKIEFVHQLQNLYFALTGEELLIAKSHVERL